MKRISYSWNPTISQINVISFNLKEKFNRTFNVAINCWAYDFSSNDATRYQISILPALDGIHACSVQEFLSWSDLLSWYLEVMKEGLPNE